ncbi:MAG TPA: energy transducer TonB [Candidatus Angelobacter sp.]|nr:energy transducer TonB [Candidatus Angelobacter sp.]
MNTHTLIAEESVEAPRAAAEPFALPNFKTPVRLNLFSDCLVEPTGSQRKLRRRTILFSVTLQCLVAGILILIPLIYPDALPAGQLVSYLMTAPPPPPAPAPAPPVVKPVNITSNIMNGQLVAPTKIPAKIQMIREEEAPPPMSLGVAGGVVGGVPGGQAGGVMNGILGGIVGPTHPPAMATPVLAKRVRVSQGVSEGLLLSKVAPEYPRIAILGRIGGAVVLDAIISREGIIENLHVVSGSPVLTGPAMEAVSKWRYRPYLLSGMPVEVETRVTVMFELTAQ